MEEKTVVQFHLPRDIIAAIRAYKSMNLTEEEQIKVPLALGLFVQGSISLAKAAWFAGMTRYEFAFLLKQIGLSAYEYTKTDYREDMDFVASVMGA